MNLSVNPSDNSCCSTIAEALKAASSFQEPVSITISAGRYREKLEILQPNITLIGEDPQNTVIEYDDCAIQTMPDGSKRGTFRSYTLLVHTSHVTLRNLTIANTAGPGKTVSQAIALYAEGDGIQVVNCRLTGSQDTLFTGPLPAKENIPGGFTGPTQFAPRVNGRQYYKDCYICGGVDFIFGSATAYFENCTIESVDGPGYATAASTPKGQTYGYVFDRCRFISQSAQSCCYLGRPWREYAKTVILNSEIQGHILPQGWNDWGKPKAHELAFYAEYHNYGPGADLKNRADWIHVLTDEEAAAYTRECILGF